MRTVGAWTCSSPGSSGFIGIGAASRHSRRRGIVRRPAATWHRAPTGSSVPGIPGVARSTASALDGVERCRAPRRRGDRGEEVDARAEAPHPRQPRRRAPTCSPRTLAGARRKPSVLVSASAIGYYGNRGDEELTEDSRPGDDFAADVCRSGRRPPRRRATPGIRVVPLRTGIVLSPKGGVLKRLLLPFKLGLGGRTGSGQPVHELDHPRRRDPRDRLRARRTSTVAGPAQPHRAEPGDQPRAHEHARRGAAPADGAPDAVAAAEGPLRRGARRDPAASNGQTGAAGRAVGSRVRVRVPRPRRGVSGGSCARSDPGERAASPSSATLWGDRGVSNPRPPGSQPGALSN